MTPVTGNFFKQLMAKCGYNSWNCDVTRNVEDKKWLKGAMFVGVDVSHDGRARSAYTFDANCRGKSTVGFVATQDDKFCTFQSYLTFQTKNVECVQESKELMKRALQSYYTQNKAFPSTVFVYRDGVGNSQLKPFVQEEVKLYRQAFAELNIKPKLEVVVVQKRIGERFLIPCQPGCEMPRCNGNSRFHPPYPGTMVDTVISSPLYWDFYIVPTTPPPGTSPRPVRYIVLVDELKISPDDMYNLTYQFCFAYQNWPGPIRVPVPVMLADKLAYLFGKHINGRPAPAIASKVFYL